MFEVFDRAQEGRDELFVAVLGGKVQRAKEGLAAHGLQFEVGFRAVLAVAAVSLRSAVLPRPQVAMVRGRLVVGGREVLQQAAGVLGGLWVCEV